MKVLSESDFERERLKEREEGEERHDTLRRNDWSFGSLSVRAIML